MTKSLKTAKEKLQNAFPGIKPLSPEENRLFACLSSLDAIKKDLETRLLPLEEVNSAPWRELKPGNTLTAWSFSLLLTDKLQQKGWNVFSQEGQDPVLSNALTLLTTQAESGRLSFNMTLAGYKKDEHKAAVKFMCDHVGDLEAVVTELRNTSVAELLNDRYLMTFVSKSTASRHNLKS